MINVITKGMFFNYLETIEPAMTKSNRKGWKCKCICGQETIVRDRDLENNIIQSCGCMKHQTIGERKRTHGEAGGLYEGKRSRLYTIWSNMKTRCTNPNVRSYADYGAKGINVCDEWQDFQNFANWARTNGYKDNLTIERKNIDGNYCPENCEWITSSENSKRAHQRNGWARNLDTNEYFEFECAKDFAKEHNLSHKCISLVIRGINKQHKNWIFGRI